MNDEAYVTVQIPKDLVDRTACLFRASLWARDQGEVEMANTLLELEQLIGREWRESVR